MSASIARAWLPTRGSIRLIGLRLLALVAAGFPAAVRVQASLSDETDRPWFTDPAVQDVFWLFTWLESALEDAVIPLLLASALALLADQLLTAGAVRWLSPDRERGRFELVAPAVIGEGTRWLWPALRVALVAAVVGGGGAAAIAALTAGIADTRTEVFPIQVAGSLAGFAWLCGVGAAAHLALVVALTDGRRVIRKALWLAAKLAWRRPVRGLLLTWGMGVLAAPLPGLVLVAWRRADPVGDWTTWAALWLGALLVQAVVWHGLIRGVQALWAEQEDLRATPDEGFGLWDWLRGKLGRKVAAG